MFANEPELACKYAWGKKKSENKSTNYHSVENSVGSMSTFRLANTSS